MELGEGDGELMKMLMQTDQPDENIQRPMEDSAMVQSGAYSQTGMSYGSAHYGGMQQQLPTIGHQQQQQQRSSSFHPMSPGQMIPRSPNNGMMQQDMDLVLQQQQYQQQQQQQPAYGNGNYQAYNGGYRGPTPMSPQTHAQPMGPYQGGFSSEPGFPQASGTNQAIGEFGTQAGANQSMGMPGPASLSLANLSARQQYYADGYTRNPPVSPVHKQMQQGGGFLQPSGMPYSQQVQTYQSSSYPKRPSPSSVQSQMQGFNTGGSYAPRASAGMQMPNMPYQSPTSPYQPPHSPVMRSTTSPVQQQDTGLYSRPRESFPQPRSPFGSSQGQFQQQQQQHSSCMFVQPGTTPPQSQYQSHQQMVGPKTGGLTQRRASYPGQQSTMKMPSPPLKRSPPSPLPNPKSPDLSRGNQLGFDERGSIKTVSIKEKSSLSPYFDPSIVVSASQIKEAMPKKVSEGHKGLPRQRRSASDVGRASVSPPAIRQEGIDGNVNEVEVNSRKREEGFPKIGTEKKAEGPKKSNGTRQGEGASHSPKKQSGEKGEDNIPRSSEYKGNDSCSNVAPEQNKTAVETAKPENVAQFPQEPLSKAQQVIFTTKAGCKEGEDKTIDTDKSTNKTKAPIRGVRDTTAVGSVELDKNDGIARDVTDQAGEKRKKDQALSGNESTNGKGDELTGKMGKKSASSIGKTTGVNKSEERGDDGSGKASGGTGKSCGENANVKNKSSNKFVSESSKPGDETDIPSEKNMSEAGKAGKPIDEANGKPVKTGKEKGESGNIGVKTSPETADKTVDSVGNRDVNEDNEKGEGQKTDIVKTGAKETAEREEPVKSTSEVTPSSNKCEASTIEEESKEVVEEKPHSKTSERESTPAVEVQKKPAVVSLRCEERLSSDEDDHAPSAPPVESKTQGIQTTEQTTVAPRATHQQATPVKATIIAKGKSNQGNQQVMVAKTTTGQMYLIQGNILVPVQSVTSKDGSSSKQNSKVIIVNPLKSSSGHIEGIKQLQTMTAGKSAGDKGDNIKTSKATSEKEKASDEGRPSAGNMKTDDSVRKSDRSPNSQNDKKTTDNSPASKQSKMSDKGTSTIAKEKPGSKTESPVSKDLKNAADKQEKISSPTKQTITMEESKEHTPKTPGRGRPPGSKDKQKRKPFVHKSKRRQDKMEVGVKTEEPASKRKFSKTASVVKEMSSSSTEPLTSSKRPLALDIPTVNASKSPKRRKISTSSSPVKHISTKPRGGVDGDSWVCSLCGKRSGFSLLGDLYGPYKTKYSKEKTDSSSAKDGKLSQKLSSPGRKLGSSSDTQVDRKSSSNEDDLESCDVDLWIHRDCGVWSPGVFMLGKTLHGLEQAVESAAQHKCTKCSEVGATLVCFKRGCNKMFHFACARDSGCSFIEDNFTIFCSAHK